MELKEIFKNLNDVSDFQDYLHKKYHYSEDKHDILVDFVCSDIKDMDYTKQNQILYALISVNEYNTETYWNGDDLDSELRIWNTVRKTWKKDFLLKEINELKITINSYQTLIDKYNKEILEKEKELKDISC